MHNTVPSLFFPLRNPATHGSLGIDRPNNQYAGFCVGPCSSVWLHNVTTVALHLQTDHSEGAQLLKFAQERTGGSAWQGSKLLLQSFYIIRQTGVQAYSGLILYFLSISFRKPHITVSLVFAFFFFAPRLSLHDFPCIQTRVWMSQAEDKFS